MNIIKTSIQRILDIKGIQRYILMVGLMLVALRLIFPVMHILTKFENMGVIEPCVSSFYPFYDCNIGMIKKQIKDKNANLSDSDRNIAFQLIASFRPDFIRTFYQAFGILILDCVLLSFVKKSKKESIIK